MLVIKYKDPVSGNFIKLNPIYTGVSVEPKLDEYGTFSFQYPIADSKAQYLTKRTEIQIIEGTDVFIAGRITNVVTTYNGVTPVKQVSGVDLLEEFANDMTPPNILFINQRYDDILDPTYTPTLIRPTNWDTVIEPTDEALTYLSSMQSSLQTFKIVKRQLGYHYRYIGTELNNRIIEFGAFGDNNGVRVMQYPPSLEELPDDYLLIEEGGLVETEDSLNIINYVFPIGGGGNNGMNQLTLRDVDPLIVDPAYPILIDPEIPNTDAIYDPSVYGSTKTGPNTFEAYYIHDQDSRDEYGTIKKPIEFNDIYPVSDTDGSISDTTRILAANELYKASVQFLKENKDAKISYSVNCVGSAPSLKVGDKVTVKYKGNISRINPDGSQQLVYVDINTDMWVQSIGISWDEQEIKRYSLELTVTEEKPKDDSDVIGSVVESVSNSKRLRSGSVTTYPVYFEDSFDADNPAEFLFWVPDEVVYTDYIKMKVRIKKFRSYSRATLGGGATTATSSAGGGTTQTSSGGGAHSHTVTIPSHKHTVNATTTNSEGTGTSAHQHTVSVTGIDTTIENAEAAGYKVLMVNPGGGGSMGACAFGAPAGGSLFASNADGLLNSLTFKTNCTINGHNHSINAQTTASGGGSVKTSSSVANHTHDVTIPNHTHNVTLPDHTHALEFGIFEDSNAPTGVKIHIDGVDYSSEFGAMSAFGFYPSSSSQFFDVMKFADNLGFLDTLLEPGVHLFRVSCATGRARVQLFLYNQFYLSSR